MRTRELEPTDAAALLAWAQDPEGSRFFLGDTSQLRLENMQSFILGALLLEDQLHLAVLDEQADFAGLVSLKHIQPELGRAEFSIGLLPGAQGRGLAREAAADILELAFLELGLQRIYMYTDQENLATQHFNDQCGFRPLAEAPAGVQADCPGPVCWYGLERQEYFRGNLVK